MPTLRASQANVETGDPWTRQALSRYGWSAAFHAWGLDSRGGPSAAKHGKEHSRCGASFWASVPLPPLTSR